MKLESADVNNFHNFTTEISNMKGRVAKRKGVGRGVVPSRKSYAVPREAISLAKLLEIDKCAATGADHQATSWRA